MLQEKLLMQQLEKEMLPYRNILSKAANTIREQDVSSYPIFVAHKEELVEIGLILIDRNTSQSIWSFNASTLEEFVAKQIIEIEKLEEFKTLYKNKNEELCIFILSDLGANFIFIPKN